MGVRQICPMLTIPMQHFPFTGQKDDKKKREKELTDQFEWDEVRWIDRNRPHIYKHPLSLQ